MKKIFICGANNEGKALLFVQSFCQRMCSLIFKILER